MNIQIEVLRDIIQCPSVSLFLKTPYGRKMGHLIFLGRQKSPTRHDDVMIKNTRVMNC